MTEGKAMRQRISNNHIVFNGLFIDVVKAQKVTTSGTREQIERKIARRMKNNRRQAQQAAA